MRDGDGPLAWAAIDFLSALILVVYTLIAPPPQPSSAIDTYGVYAVTIAWPGKLTDDVDLYVQNPRGQIVYFANRDAGLMSLERDDLGRVSDVANYNSERVVLRGAERGEYVVNVHLYRQASRQVPVTVKLYRLRGDDALVTRQQVVLKFQGDERTAFRFAVDGAGKVSRIGHLQRRFVATATPGGVR